MDKNNLTKLPVFMGVYTAHFKTLWSTNMMKVRAKAHAILHQIDIDCYKNLDLDFIQGDKK